MRRGTPERTLGRSREIEGADAKSFGLIARDGVYAKDAKHVYFRGVPIVDAGPLTFKVLIYPFSQDKERAFIGAAPIPGPDRGSWRPLRKGHTGDYWNRRERDCSPKQQETDYTAGWSRDANAFYYGRKVVSDIDEASFKVLSDYYAKDKRHVYSRYYYDKLAVIEDADPTTFVVHEDVDAILTRGADAHDINSKFRWGKVFESK